MSIIYSHSFHGGEGHTDGDDVPLALAFQDAAADLNVLRNAIVGITAKLDLDAGVTDTDYASLWDPVAMTTINGDLL